MDTVIVTRHSGLVDWLKRRGIEGEVLPHADEATVKNKHVYGVLPFRLAALAGRFTEVSLDVPPELRGKELTADDIDGLSPRMTEWTVREGSADDLRDAIIEEHEREQARNRCGAFMDSIMGF